MTQIDPSDDFQDDPKGLREAVERSNREAAEARQALADLQRKDAFRDAGLDPANPLHVAVINGYDGEIDGVKDFVSGLGLNSTPEPPAIPATEQAALERVGSMTGGDSAPLDPDADGNARLKAIADQAVREKWGTNRFNDEFTAEMVRQRRPVQSMDIAH